MLLSKIRVLIKTRCKWENQAVDKQVEESCLPDKLLTLFVRIALTLERILVVSRVLYLQDEVNDTLQLLHH
jgi:hypothetical protein